MFLWRIFYRNLIRFEVSSKQETYLFIDEVVVLSAGRGGVVWTLMFITLLMSRTYQGVHPKNTRRPYNSRVRI
jgi:hypothetical protein